MKLGTFILLLIIYGLHTVLFFTVISPMKSNDVLKILSAIITGFGGIGIAILLIIFIINFIIVNWNTKITCLTK